MQVQPYTRTGMLQRLDADPGAVCGLRADLALARISNRHGFGCALALCAWMLLIPASLATGQVSGAAPIANTRSSTKSSTAKPHVNRKLRHRHHARPAAASIKPALTTPAPPLPPAEQPATPATVDFNNGQLTIRAQNSGLLSILGQVQRQTGLVIDGLSHDQRVYGQYGPGSISSTLTALLNGTGYDFVIVGGANAHDTARLILSTPGNGGDATTTPPAVGNDQQPPPADGSQNGDQTQPADPTAPTQPKTSQEFFNEMRNKQPQ